MPRVPVFYRLLVLVFASSCARRAAPPSEQEASSPPLTAPPTQALTLGELRESARETLDSSCAECHTTGLPTALPRALRVFDLTEPDWSRRMSEAQLREAARRLNEPFAPTRGEGDVRPIHVSEEARSRFVRFLEAEVAHRREGRGG